MPADFQWVHSQNGMVISGAVEAGRTIEGEILYVGRVFHNGVMTAGKVSDFFPHSIYIIPCVLNFFDR